MRQLSSLTASCLLGAALFVATGHARAQSATAAEQEESPPGAVRVHVTSAETPLNVAVVPRRGHAAVAACTTPECVLWLLPGRYTLRARNPKEGEEFDLSLRVDYASEFQLSPGDYQLRTAGALIGVAGPIAIIAGAIALFEGIAETECDECSTKNSGSTARAGGFVAILVGAIATPAGWVMYAENRPHLERVGGDSAMRPRPAAYKLGLLPFPHGGWGLGGSVIF
jgi:hypothetical protein